MDKSIISSMSNGQIRNLIQLQKKAKIRDEQNVFLVEGIKMYEEIPGDRLQKVYVSETFYHEVTTKNAAYFNGICIEIVRDDLFKEVSDTITPQGILAVVKQSSYDLQEILSCTSVNLLILEDIRDPGNLGTIVRTAEGAGITGIIMSSATVDIYNPKVIRSTMGSIYRMPFLYISNLKDALRELQDHEIKLYASHLAGRNHYDDEVYADKTGILIGNEANGLSSEISACADTLIRIPMSGKVESLNAAVAASILMYEIYRQKRKK